MEREVIPNFNLHQFYRFQRDLFLAMVGLELEAWLNQQQFQTLWTFCGLLSIENLLTKILAQQHLRLLDPFSAYVTMGDIGARIYLYYAGCERHLHHRWMEGKHSAQRKVDWVDYGKRMAQQFYGQSHETMSKWKASLEKVLPLVQDEGYFLNALSCNLNRTYHLDRVEDFTSSHYIYNRDRAIQRIDRYLQTIHTKKAPLLSMQGQVQFLTSPAGYLSPPLSINGVPVEGSVANRRYLGNYPKLFDDEQERPVPTWAALAWILEDYGLSRTEPITADLIYKQVSGPWPMVFRATSSRAGTSAILPLCETT